MLSKVGTNSEQASAMQQLCKLNLMADAARCIFLLDEYHLSKNPANTLEIYQTIIDQYASPSTTSPTIPHE